MKCEYKEYDIFYFISLFKVLKDFINGNYSNDCFKRIKN